MMAKASAKAPRAQFALPEKKEFPLNTAGRRKVAVKDAVASERAGNITGAEVAKIRRAVAAKSGGKASAKTGEGSRADKAQDKRGMKATGMNAKQYEASARDKKEDAARTGMKTCPSCGAKTKAAKCPNCGKKL
jgi:hypothetical protein